MRLEKYYFDGVSADGKLFICYSAVLHVGFIKIPYTSVMYHCDDKTIEKHKFKKELVLESSDRVSLIADSLDFFGLWMKKGAEIDKILYSDNYGRDFVNWNVISDAAEGTVQAHGTEYKINGYLEKITIQMPGLKLPIKRLLWGRWISDDLTRSIVWIVWQDKEGNYLVKNAWDNGNLCEVEDFDLDHIYFDSVKLDITKLGSIRNAEVTESVPLLKGKLQKLLPSSFKNIMENKYIGEAELDGLKGKVIYEEVIWH